MRRAPLLAALLLLAACRGAAPAGPDPHQIRLVGAAAGLPFTAAVAEDFMRAETDAIAPLVQAGGSGAGIARFCGGLGARHPDLVAATRPMTAPERQDCAAHGVRRIAEIPFGWSALVLVARPGVALPGLTRADLARALGGPARLWSDIRPGLPPRAIAIEGPTPRPAIADGLFELLVGPGRVRGGDAYRGHGADAGLVADAVAHAPPGAIGILPYADAIAHADTLAMLPLDGVTPDPATIADGRYPARLPLVLMVKSGEAPAVPGMAALLRLFAAGLAPGGRFAPLGLVPLAAPARDDAIAKVRSLAAA